MDGMATHTSSDVCVVGGGVIGLATAASLRERGIDVVCLERSAPGDGQSAGGTRQFRHLHDDSSLIELAVRAREGWLRWEERAGRMLLGSEGALRLGWHPCELDALRAAGVPAVELDPHLAHDRFPVAALPDRSALWDPLAGAIRAAETISVMTAWIGSALDQAHVSSIEVTGDSVQVHTTHGLHRSARCVVCAGAGTDRLVAPLGFELMQDRQAHLRLTFRAREWPAEPLPCFSDRTSEAGEQVYALSDLGDRYAVGLAPVTEYPAVADLAIDVPAGIDLSSQRERIVSYVKSALPGLDPTPVGAVQRLTTALPEYPDDGFAIWHQGPVVAVAGPNLFKFAPLIGERLALAATGDADANRERRGPVRRPPETVHTASAPRHS
jgi:sarcosine oxidase